MFTRSFPHWHDLGQALYHRRMMDETPIAKPATGNLPEFSVSELSNLLKRTVEDAFPFVRVRGEVSRVSRPASGHCYYELKDERAVISAVTWKATYPRLKVKPEQGIEVICTGRITTFENQSKYQIIVEQMELAGLGALMAMLEARKKKLAAEGLFDSSRKKPIPFIPRVIGVITSPSGAVIRDIMHRLKERCPRRVLLWPVTVQGERAPAEIVAAIRGFNALGVDGPIPRPDVLIVARGGGSFEDLLAFSDEAVVRAAAASAIPLVSAVGHETDTTLIDFVSDKRAPTPTAAAEMAVPVLRDCVENLGSLQQRLLRAASRFLDRRRQQVQGLARALPRADALFALPRQRFDASAGRLRSALFQNLQRHSAKFSRTEGRLRPQILKNEIMRGAKRTDDLEARLTRAYDSRLSHAAAALRGCARILDGVSYRAVLARGFVLVTGPGGILKRRMVAVKTGESLTLTFADGQIGATSKGKQTPKQRISVRGQSTQGDLF
jgi:exodeoxyribonuclease VII large subunit